MESSNAVTALRGLAHDSRLAAYRTLIQAGRDGLPVGELRDRLGIAAATLTAHLNVLRNAGLVVDQREGRVIRVRADFERMAELIDYLTENCCGGRECLPLSPNCST